MHISVLLDLCVFRVVVNEQKISEQKFQYNKCVVNLMKINYFFKKDFSE